MWVVNGTYVILPGQREHFTSAAAEHRIVEQIRSEQGNVSYHYYYPVDNQDQLVFFGVWESEAAWRAHLRNSYVTEDLQRIKDTYLKELRLNALGELAAKS